MDEELLEDRNSHVPTEIPNEDFSAESNHEDQELGSRTITWTLTCLGAKVHPKAYERLKTEINWVEMSEEGGMTFRSTDMDQIDAFSKKLKAIFSENEEHNTVREFSFTISSYERPLLSLENC